MHKDIVEGQGRTSDELESTTITERTINGLE
jgi:hypothetical protein